MLSNTDIEEICDSLKLPLVGVFSKNKLPQVRHIGSYYINLQDEEDGNGTHWTWFRIFENGKAVYFDSFGFQLPEDIKEFLKPFAPIPYNNRQIQDINSSYCGWFCLACDYYFTYEAKRKDTEEDFDDFLNLFSINKIANDKIAMEILDK